MRSFLLTLTLALFGVSLAQSIEVRAGATPSPAVGVSYLWNPSWGEAQASVAYLDHAALLSGSFTAHAAASAISNLTFDGVVTARIDGHVQGVLGVRGTIGPVAARLTLRGFSTSEEAFWRAPQLTPPRPNGSGFGVDLSATYRSGDFVYTLLPTYTLTSTGQYVHVAGEVRWLRAIERHEVRLTGAFWSGADWTEGEGTAGATLVLNRGRKPAWEFGALLTMNEHGVTPGVRFAITEQFAGGKSISVTGAVTPRSVVHPLVALETTALVPAGAVQWRFAAMLTYHEAQFTGAGEVRLRIPLTEGR